MTSARIAEAKKLYAAQDKTVQEIADIFGVSRPNIYRALESPPRKCRVRSFVCIGISAPSV
jgi:DNA-binding transcriptional regulator LsrR (DeoR family)